MKTLDARLLALLRETAVHQPVGECAAQLHATPAQIRERLAGLRMAGYEIEDRPGLGLRLIAAPDRLIADDLSAQLGACGLVREIVVFAETGSTNDCAAQLGRQGAPGGQVIFAERQTSGRGRFGRRWDSASHRGLWFSMLLRPSLAVPQWPRLTTWAAVAIAMAIEKQTGERAMIKWPNDVFVGGRKVAGILIESGADRGGAPFAVVGIGVNVNHEAGDFPPRCGNWPPRCASQAADPGIVPPLPWQSLRSSMRGMRVWATILALLSPRLARGVFSSDAGCNCAPATPSPRASPNNSTRTDGCSFAILMARWKALPRAK